ncbi:lysosomal proton-coupled steroid conjugate and bile acid symporter SLC46A3-like [Liolophura sinensis]|uniref:lysosomal proton-coupled steroid conjugate and bile acid symporter SLC46A3-like n=1 Tax=Liolophura sinensis TaxID=3198878 RepID=UPI00315849D7
MAIPDHSECQERSPLLSSSQSSADQKFPQRPRSVPVEILLLSYFVASMTLVPVEQLYVFSRVKDKHGQNPLAPADNSSIKLKNESNTDRIDSQRCVSQWTNLSSFDAENDVQAEAATWMLVLTLCENACAMISTCLLGALIDMKGRKLGVVVPMLGSLLKIVVFLAVVLFELPIALLILADVLEGASGYYGTVFCAVLAHLADITTTTKEKATRINIALALNGICIGLTYLGMGFFISHAGFVYPLLFSLVILLMSLPLAIFLFPETLSGKREEQTKSRSLNLIHFLSAFLLYHKKHPAGRQWKLLALAASFFSFNLVITGRGNVQSLYQLASPLCWSAVDIGYFGAAQTMGQQLVTLVLFPALRRRLSELPIAVFGTLSGIAACLLQAFATTDLLMYTGELTFCLLQAFCYHRPADVYSYGGWSFSNVCAPTVKTAMSSLVGPHEQGAMFASLGIIQMVCSCVAQVVFNSIYVASLSVFPGTVFLTMAALLLTTFFLLLLTYIGTKGPGTYLYKAQTGDEVRQPTLSE